MGAALILGLKVVLVLYLVAIVISFITGYRWKERKKELEGKVPPR